MGKFSQKVQKRSTTTSLTKSEMYEVIDYYRDKSKNSESEFRNYLLIVLLFTFIEAPVPASQ